MGAAVGLQLKIVCRTRSLKGWLAGSRRRPPWLSAQDGPEPLLACALVVAAATRPRRRAIHIPFTVADCRGGWGSRGRTPSFGGALAAALARPAGQRTGLGRRPARLPSCPSGGGLTSQKNIFQSEGGARGGHPAPPACTTCAPPPQGSHPPRVLAGPLGQSRHWPRLGWLAVVALLCADWPPNLVPPALGWKDPRAQKPVILRHDALGGGEHRRTHRYLDFGNSHQREPM